jgi:hypothetical protein
MKLNVVPRATMANEGANEPVFSAAWSKVTPKTFYDKNGQINTESLDP